MGASRAAARRIGIGCDHLGPELKRSLRVHLEAQGLAVTDIGVEAADTVDYPDIGAALARRLASASNTSASVSVAASSAGASQPA